MFIVMGGIMKKLSVYLLMIMCLFMTGCGEDKVKVSVTLDDFNTVLTNKGFTVNDNMNAYSGVDYIIDSKKAILDDIEIEMVKYSNSDYAGKVLDSQIDSFNLLKSTGAQEKKDKGSNYYRYSLVSNGRYMISTRVDDTLVFCKTLLENKEIVEEIYNELGY